MLPTPTNSVELTPRKSSQLASEDTFDLGPAALAPSSPSSIKFSTVSNGHETLPSPNSPYSIFPASSSTTPPTEPIQPVKGRTRSASTSKVPAAKRAKKTAPVIKPPPPRRNPIIQMQPNENATSNITTGATGGKATKKAGAGSTRKISTTSTADERRKARKSTHSEIERRRRLKINSQFALLRSLVPACRDQDMHKLTILEATTEYIQYLVESIKHVKGLYDDDHVDPDSATSTIAPSSHATTPNSQNDSEDDDEQDQDQEMDEDEEKEEQSYDHQGHQQQHQHRYHHEQQYRHEEQHPPSLMDISAKVLSKCPSTATSYEEDCCVLDDHESTNSDYDATQALLLLSDRKGSMDSTAGRMEVCSNPKPLSVMEMLS